MTKQEKQEYIEALDEYVVNTGLQCSTVSFYCELVDGESVDVESHFGTCEITGIRGDIVPCIGLDADNNIFQFYAGTWIVHSVLGKRAGAF